MHKNVIYNVKVNYQKRLVQEILLDENGEMKNL